MCRSKRVIRCSVTLLLKLLTTLSYFLLLRLTSTTRVNVLDEEVVDITDDFVGLLAIEVDVDDAGKCVGRRSVKMKIRVHLPCWWSKGQNGGDGLRDFFEKATF